MNHSLTERRCGSCSLCCILPEIAEFDKPANQPCLHCLPQGGCRNYDLRPKTCADFTCLWLSDANVGPHWEPPICGMMVYSQGRQLTVLVDAARQDLAPALWNTSPYREDLIGFSRRLGGEQAYVVIYLGDEVSVLYPQDHA